MVKGRRKNEQFYLDSNFPPEFVSFLNAIGKSEVKLQYYNDESSNRPAIMFNSCFSVEEFNSSLSASYAESITEIQKSVENLKGHIKKINYVTQCIAEIDARRSLFILRDYKYTHIQIIVTHNLKNVEDRNVQLNEDNIQPFYKVQIYYSDKMKSFLRGFKSNITAIAPAEWDDSILSFFENIIKRNGYQELIQELISGFQFPERIELSSDQNLILKEQYFDPEGEANFILHDFSDEFKSIISNETQNAIELLKKGIKSAAYPHIYLKLLIGEIGSLIEQANENQKGYYSENCKVALYDILKFLQDDLDDYLDRKHKKQIQKIYESKSKNSQKTVLEPKNIGHDYAFKLKNISLEIFIPKCWAFLKDEYVLNSDYELFFNIFTGEKPEEAIVKIKWQKLYNNNTNKKSLFYFFTQLQENEFLEQMEPSILKKKLRKLFCNQDGTDFNSTLDQNYDAFKYAQGKHDKIDKLMKSLLSS